MSAVAGKHALGALAATVIGAGVLITVMVAGLGEFATVALFLATLPAGVALRAALLRTRRPAQDDDYPLVLAWPSAALYTAFFLLPLVLVVIYSLATRQGYGDVVYSFSFHNFAEALSGLYLQAFGRSLRFAVIGTIVTVLVGFPFAYWLARYSPVRRRNLLLALVMVPYVTAFLIRAYAWRLVLSEDFLLAQLLRTVGLLDGPLNLQNTGTAVQIGIVYNYLPLFILPVYAALERMDWRLVDAAKDLGSSGFSAFRQVTLPVVAPGVIAGSLLVFIPMTGEYIIPAVLGGGRVDFVGTLVARAFLEGQNYPFGAALGLLVVMALSGFLALYLFMTSRAERALGGV
ncbi:ABC transporter permease [Mycolicibacterium tokaiense]|uniref:Binding-protein-dependent transport systems inner membrane component n=1 Tax=Mycolicibacterium tokaiense TaxID=39695 RepID=A0A378TGS2_9MYCO|nr:ABC transporter permease [Mycolicibacterium tokaiense]BBY85539.1 ABC transporter permease [Mycolicibacterium tokaiense]STZ59949.1 binding-protein-dependent transport systems inner membrane component [Mycolicibacterium tokaiense]